MGEFSKVELKILENCTEAMDSFIYSLISSQNDKDKLLFASCLNDDEKYDFTKSEIKKMQKKLTKCNPNIAEYIRCYINPSEMLLSGDSLDQHKNRLILNFLIEEFEDVLEVLTSKFTTLKDVEDIYDLFWGEIIEDGEYGIDKKYMKHFIKYMALAERLSGFKSILESIEEERKEILDSKAIDINPMEYKNFQNDENEEVLIVEELEKRLAIEAVEYKSRIDNEWETYKFDPTYFDSFISGALYAEFVKSLYDRIKPLNDFEINKYLTLSVNQFKTHLPVRRKEAFNRLYHATYWFPNYMEYNDKQYENKYPMHVWKHYTTHFDIFKEATEGILNDFKNGFIGSGKKEQVIPKPKLPQNTYQSFEYKFLNTNPDAIADLMDSLKKNNFIDANTRLTDFKKIFSGDAIINKITWIGNVSELSHFVKNLIKDKNLIEDLKQRHWKVTINSFVMADESIITVKKLKGAKTPARIQFIKNALKNL